MKEVSLLQRLVAAQCFPVHKYLPRYLRRYTIKHTKSPAYLINSFHPRVLT